VKKTTRVLITGAAMGGLTTGVIGRVQACQAADNQNTTGISSWGQMDDSGDKGSHDCAGKNECKGLGGCKSGDNGCSGKNSCKGKGGCASHHDGQDHE